MSPEVIRLMIVEDEPAHAEALRRAIEEGAPRVEVRIVPSLKEFRAAVAESPPDLAVVDILLPDGRAESLLTSPPEAGAFPIVLMTSHGDEDVAVAAMKAGAIEYVVKSPETFAAMPQIVERALREWRLRRERLEMEKALRKSEAKYRQLHESMRDAFVSTSMDGRIREFNEAYRSMVGYEREELLTLTRRDLTPAKWHAMETEIIEKQVLRSGYSEVYEKEYRRKDGTVFPVELRTTLLRDDFGEPAGTWAVVRDITERRSAERSLAQASDRYRDLFENSGTGVIIVDRQGRYLMVNRNAAARFARPPEEVVGQSVFDLLPEAAARRHVEFNRLLLESGGTREYEDTFRLPTGERTFLVVDRCLKDENGENFAIQSSSVDITARKLAEESLRRSEEEYRFLFDSAPVGIGVTGIDGGVYAANRCLLALLGLTIDEFRAVGSVGVYADPDCRKGVIETLRKVGSVQDRETRLVRRDGSVITALLNAQQMERGGRTFIFSTMRDITEIKRAEEKLKESEEKYRRLFATDSNAIQLIDAGTLRFVDVNEASVKLYGHAREEFLAMTALDVSAEPEASALALRRMIAGELGRVPIRLHRRKDGTTFPVEISAGMLSLKGRKVVCCVARDITERMETSRALADYQERLRATVSELVLAEERERRRIAGGLHDQISQTLALLCMRVEVLAEQAESKEFARQCREILATAQGALESTRSLTFEISPAILYQLGLAPAVKKLAREMERRSGIRFTVDTGGRLADIEENMRVQLFQILRELATNVVKHSGARTCRLSVKTVRKRIHLSVHDNGAGFDPGALARSKSKTGSYGLFSIMERLKVLGGEMQVESKPGRGCTVKLWVPVPRGGPNAKENAS